MIVHLIVSKETEIPYTSRAFFSYKEAQAFLVDVPEEHLLKITEVWVDDIGTSD